ncbi:Hypothetical protein CINCED_3A006081 [Cinara cedri]|uniref:Uncharacterized protein n=1 Tax=Cinara cedri TaxID=506608 RepID=A0A5E4MIP9_9HEMI|nr:Hypothetical protein CINCED_3A006081 [Cinara cedri]
MDTKMIMAELKALRHQISGIILRQQHDSEILRKTANSVNVVVKLFAGVCDMSTEKLSSILIKADGNLHTVNSYEESNFESTNFNLNEYPINNLKTMLLNIVNMIDAGQFEQKSDSSISEAPISTNVTQDTYEAQKNNTIPDVSLVQTNIGKTTKNEKQISPDITLNTHIHNKNIKGTPSAKKNISKPTAMISPDITQNTHCQVYNRNNINSSIPLVQKNIDNSTSTVPETKISTDIDQNYIDKRKKDEEEYFALRRRYRNKYRYMNLASAQSTENSVKNTTKTPTKNVTENNVIDQTANDKFSDEVIRKQFNFVDAHVVLHKYTPPIQIPAQKGKNETEDLAVTNSCNRKSNRNKKNTTLNEKEKVPPQKSTKKSRYPNEIEARRRSIIKQINFEPVKKKKKRV